MGGAYFTQGRAELVLCFDVKTSRQYILGEKKSFLARIMEKRRSNKQYGRIWTVVM